MCIKFINVLVLLCLNHRSITYGQFERLTLSRAAEVDHLYFEGNTNNRYIFPRYLYENCTPNLHYIMELMLDGNSEICYLICFSI